MKQHDRTKLPVWAQYEIARLELDLASAREKLAVGPEDSDTFADPYSAVKRPLGRGTSIEFVMPGGPYRHIRADIRHGYLHLNGSHGLRFWPVVSNVVEIDLEK